MVDALTRVPESVKAAEAAKNGRLSPEMKEIRNSFVQAADVVEGDVWTWTELGVIKGLVPNTNEGRTKLAGDLGVFYFLTKNSDGSEKTVEDLDKAEVAYRLNASEEYTQALMNHGVEMGLVKSWIRQAKQKASSKKL